MNRKELELLLGLVQTAKVNSDFAGQFSQQTRDETRVHRLEGIYKPLDTAAKVLQSEIARLKAKAAVRNKAASNRRRRYEDANRLPYKDN